MDAISRTLLALHTWQSGRVCDARTGRPVALKGVPTVILSATIGRDAGPDLEALRGWGFVECCYCRTEAIDGWRIPGGRVIRARFVLQRPMIQEIANNGKRTFRTFRIHTSTFWDEGRATADDCNAWRLTAAGVGAASALRGGRDRRGLKMFRALQCLRRHPEWSNKKIAEAVGIRPETLSRSPVFRRARALPRGQAEYRFQEAAEQRTRNDLPESLR